MRESGRLSSGGRRPRSHLFHFYRLRKKFEDEDECKKRNPRSPLSFALARLRIGRVNSHSNHDRECRMHY